jgi:hypothetical protein
MTSALTEISDAPSDKLQAVLHHNAPDSDDDAEAAFRDACGEWFAALSNRHRLLAERVMEVYSDGNETSAMWIASALPPAPKCLL